MKTLRLELTDYKKNGMLSAGDEAALKHGAELLQNGGLVAFPTETVYGLGGNALLPGASKKIYAAKGRPSDNPLIAHIASMKELVPIVKYIPERAKRLADAFWPGPLTMILEKSESVPYETTGGLDTVAVRMPEHPAARRLIEFAGIPIAAPSANTSGRPSPTEAAHVLEDLDGKIDAVIDGGSVLIGVESTIIDLSGAQPTLLRPGAITREMLSEALGEAVCLDPALEKPLDPAVHPKAPGMKYRHYAPKAPMCIFVPRDGVFSAAALERMEQAVSAEAKRELASGCCVGILCSEETLPYYKEVFADFGERQVLLMSAGSHQSDESFAHNLFRVLREMDDAGVGFIAAEGTDTAKIGYAVMNRMKKAAGQQVRYI